MLSSGLLPVQDGQARVLSRSRQEAQGSAVEKLFATPWRGRAGACIDDAPGAAHQHRASAALQPSPAQR